MEEKEKKIQPINARTNTRRVRENLEENIRAMKAKLAKMDEEEV